MSDGSEEKRELFARKMADVLNFGALNLAMGIGYRTGLFEAMDALNAPATVEAVAKKAGLAPRYIKEWLGVMVCAGVVEHARTWEGEDLFSLPPEHGDFLCRRSGNNNLGVYTQEIPLLTLCAMEEVVKGFKTGDGVDYANYPRFQAFMSQLADAKHEQVLVDEFLPSVDQGRLVDDLKSGIRVCDLGCGEGVAVLLMAKAYPNSRITGIDIDPKALAKAENKAREMNLANARFIQKDAAAIADDPAMASSFDYITAFDSIHDQTRPQEALTSVFAMLRPNGRFSMVDIAAETPLTGNKNHPMGPFLYVVSLMHCMPVGLVNNGAGLGMMWGKQKALQMLQSAGFTNPHATPIPNDSFNLHFYCVKNG